MRDSTKSSIVGLVAVGGGVFVLVLLIGTLWRGACQAVRPAPRPGPSVSRDAAAPAPPQPSSEPVRPVDKLEEVAGRWEGPAGEWVEISPRRPGSPYPWSLTLQPFAPHERPVDAAGPLDCGFYPRAHANEPTEPAAGSWRVAYCLGADLPGDGGRHAMRLVLSVQPGNPIRLHVLVGTRYVAVLRRSADASVP